MVIALFDNDAERYNSVCALQREKIKWSNSIRIMSYPEIKSVGKYPTIASNGKNNS